LHDYSEITFHSTMKHKILLFSFLFSVGNVFANIRHIDLSKITADPHLKTLFRFVADNEKYYSQWIPQWNYEKSKPELDLKLQEAYRAFYALQLSNEESYLLLGDIAHYLYNLEVKPYYDSALVNYHKATLANPKDFRCYWFVGFHFAQSTRLQDGIDNIFRAQRMLSSPGPADFWNEYAWVTAIANMPSHSVYAMDRAREILGTPGNMETQFGSIVRKRIVAVDRDSTYSKQAIWSVSNGEGNTFTSRPFGTKMNVDSTWQVSIYDYTKRMGAFVLSPPTAKNKNGRDIHYTIALLMKTAADNDELDTYLQQYISKFDEKKKINFSKKKYDKMLAYEIKDKTMYPDIGGGHLYMIGIERNAPPYPGLLLEDPSSFPDANKKNEVSYYRPSNSRNRFTGKIFYAIILDSCEDIHEESLSVFKTFFEKQLVIE